MIQKNKLVETLSFKVSNSDIWNFGIW